MTPDQSAKIKATVVALAPFAEARRLGYIPQEPTRKQLEFLALNGIEAFYGGAAGGGKSSALLMAALMYVHVPGYSALLLRRTYPDLNQAGALIPRSQEWLGPTNARWNGSDKRWTFPSGATLAFGHMANANDMYNYQGSELQFVGFDELTQFPEACYRYLFSRTRRLEGVNVPIRIRSASNPGGIGHKWVRAAMVDNQDTPFVVAKIADNPYLDQAEYLESLSRLDHITRAQLQDGDWSVHGTGGMFNRTWFEIVEDIPREAKVVRYWDLAATPEKNGNDPDWTAGALVGLLDGVWYIADMRHVRETPLGVEKLVKATATLDTRAVSVYIEQEPGSAGAHAIDLYRRRILPGYAVKSDRPTGPKDVRAKPVSAAAEAGNVKLIRGPWIPDFLDEAESFGLPGMHDDQIDAVSGAFKSLSEPPKKCFVVT